MTGYQSKKAAALDEEGMYLVHHTQTAQVKVEGPLHVVCQCDKCKAERQEPVVKLQEPTVERAWFTIAELNAWANKKLSENPHWATGNYRCLKCCLPSKECKCFTYKGVHRCDICNGTFEVGEHYYSDSPSSFVHSKCRFPKEQS